MSKIVDQFNQLKLIEPDRVILFRVGAFYISLNEDAHLLAKNYNLKLTHFAKDTVKCGFPTSRLNHYLQLLTNDNIKQNVIESKISSKQDMRNLPLEIILNESEELVKDISNIDINNLTFKSAFDILYEIHTKAKKIMKKK